MYYRNLKDRSFGLEFEHVSNQSMRNLSLKMVQAGVPMSMDTVGDFSDCYDNWQIKPDGSISVDDTYRTAIELTSPIMTFRDYPVVCKALAVAREFGGVNASCGLHVHVHAPELVEAFHSNAADRTEAYINKTWTMIEPTLFSYLPMSRRNNTYCKAGVNLSARYMALNLSSLWSNKGTIEFRLHNATLNPVKAMAFAMLCRNITHKWATLQSFAPIDPLLQFRIEPKQITKKNGTLVIERNDKGMWRLETKRTASENVSLNDAYVRIKRSLHMTGRNYLSQLHYPYFGNAMTALCNQLDINGMFRGFMEDKYDKSIRKNMIAGPAEAVQAYVARAEAEDHFYHEPELGDHDDDQPGQLPRGVYLERDQPLVDTNQRLLSSNERNTLQEYVERHILANERDEELARPHPYGGGIAERDRFDDRDTDDSEPDNDDDDDRELDEDEDN